MGEPRVSQPRRRYSSLSSGSARLSRGGSVDVLPHSQLGCLQTGTTVPCVCLTPCMELRKSVHWGLPVVPQSEVTLACALWESSPPVPQECSLREGAQSAGAPYIRLERCSVSQAQVSESGTPHSPPAGGAPWPWVSQLEHSELFPRQAPAGSHSIPGGGRSQGRP